MFMKDIAAIARYGHIYAHRNLKSIEITGSEHSIIVYLFTHNRMNQDSISRYLMLDKGTVAKALAKLEEKNFILRAPNPLNRRENVVLLTEYGHSVINDILTTSTKWENEVLAGLNDKERELFSLLCKKVVTNAQAICQKDMEGAL